MSFRIKPESVLSLSLGLMYIYSGLDLIRHPTSWIWALPFWFREIISSFIDINLFLRIHGVVELVLSFILIFFYLLKKISIVKWAAFVSALEFVWILFFTFVPYNETNLLFTFRDIGLVGASFALFFILSSKENPVVSSS